SGRDPATAVDQANLRARVLDEMTRRLQLPLLTPTTFPSIGAYEHGQMTRIFNANPNSGTRNNLTQGFTPTRAASLAGAWMSTQHALHSPDQVAGGSRLNAAGGVAPDQGLTGMGLAGVNMSIGSQWGTSGQARVTSISTQLTAFLNTCVPGGPPVTTDAEKGRIQMYVTMLPVR
ncbi:MAG: polymorphic toxin type 15 domain-containing protein, partial [Erythrobacter sp.]